MGGFGFFTDSVVRALIKEAQKESPSDAAPSWPLASGKISEFAIGMKIGKHWRSQVVFSFEVEGVAFKGSAPVLSPEEAQSNSLVEIINSIQAVNVRYDPENPASNRLLNQDNPLLPFKIDYIES